MDDGGSDLTPVEAGYLSAIDQIGLPVGLDSGFFEDQGLDVKMSQPFASGVDALNALQSGEVDFVQAGTPIIPAAQKELDLVLVGNYTGSASQRSIDDTMAMVAAEKSGIKPSDLSTIRDKRIGVTVGSINHLYLLGVLKKAGLSPKDVKIVNTGPPDMAVALETGGIDAAVIWDPWPIIAAQQVSGSYEVMRGGEYIPFVGYIVAKRSFVKKHPETVARFLAARAEADQWMRKNPDGAAQAASRWIPGTKVKVARKSVEFNTKQLDPRFSACNYLALDTVSQMLADVGEVEAGFDVSKYFDTAPMREVMDQKPELFDDLPPIPETALIDGDFTYDREAALKACP